jgi:hypothetical protein
MICEADSQRTTHEELAAPDPILSIILRFSAQLVIDSRQGIQQRVRVGKKA